MKVAAYVRSSSDKQVASPERQRASIRDYAARKQYTIVEWFEDVGVSGDDDVRRVGFQEMLRAADRHEFARVITFDRARFGRGDSIQASQWTGRLRKARVSLETAVDGKVVDWSTMTGRLTDAIDAEVAADYQRTLARNTVSGVANKLRDIVSNGLAGQPPTYGRRREVLRVDGGRIISTSVVDPVTGPIVLRMFRMYAKPGGSVRQIANTFNAEGIPALRGGAWSCSAVRGVLENPLHAGDYRYGVRQRGKHAALGKGGTIVPRDRDDPVTRGEPIYVRDAVQPTVPRALFEQVQQLLRERARQTVPEHKVKPLSGIVACGKCGQTMRGMYAGFRCCGDPRFGKACQGYVVPQQEITTRVVNGFRDKLLEPRRLKTIESALKRKAAAAATTGRASKVGASPAAIRREITRLDREISGGVEKLPLMPAGVAIELGQHLDRLRAQRAALMAQAGDDKPAAEGAGVLSVVREAIAMLRELESAIVSGESAAINEAFRRIGMRAFLDLSPAGKRVRVTFGNAPRRGGSKPKNAGRSDALRLSGSGPVSAHALMRFLPGFTLSIAQ